MGRLLTQVPAEKADAERLAALAEFRYELRRFLHFSEMSSEAQGISAQQYQLLQVVGTVAAETRVSISMIAERMMLRHNSAVELVDRATRSGLVERRVDEEDLRRSIVNMTENGRRTLATLAAAHLKELESLGTGMVQALKRVLEYGAGGDPAQTTWR